MDGTGSVESQWLTQLAAMRQAIADLKLPSDPAKEPSYGSDLELDFEDDYSSPGTIDDDIWDIISSDDESSEGYDDFDDLPSAPLTSAYDQTWLEQKCQSLASNKPGLEAHDIAQQITA